MASSKSELTVTAETLEAALEEGARQLAVKPSRIRHRVLQRGSKGFLGLFKRPWILRLWVHEPASAFVDQVLAENADINGYYRLNIRDGNVILSVHPPIENGRPVSLPELMGALESFDADAVDKVLIERTVQEQLGEEVIVGTAPTRQEIDSYLRIRVEADKMKAYVTIYPPRRGGRELTSGDVIESLEEQGIVHGIQQGQIELALASSLYDEPFLGAEGTPPLHGENGRVEYHVRTNPHLTVFQENEEGRVDYRNRNLIENVHAGEVIANLHEPTPGTDGMDIFGKTISARPGKPLSRITGKNIAVDEKTGEVIAQIDGHIIIKRNTILIEPLYTIEGDVNYETGNVEFNGSVMIKGLVEDKFNVAAEGSVYIHKSVGKSRIEAKNNILVLGGVLGKGEASLKAGGDIVARFVESAKLRAGSDIVIGELAHHSRLVADGNILMDGTRAALVGGSAVAGKTVSVKTIGGPGTSRTKIVVGMDPEILNQIEALRDQNHEDKLTREKLLEAIKTAQSPAAPEEIKAKLPLLEKREKQLVEIIKSRKDQIRQMERNAVPDPHACVKVQDRAYPGTQIEIGEVIHVVQSSRVQHCTFRRVGDEIKESPY